MHNASESEGLLSAAGCGGCRTAFPVDLTMAFQPIVDVDASRIFAFEALVRGADRSGAASVLGQVTSENRFAFDQACRKKAVELAARLGIDCTVSINFMPNAVYQPALCLGTTLAAAQRHAFPIDRIMFEVTEGERIDDRPHLRRILEEYKRQGFRTAIDDFGAGHSGLNLLADFQPDVIKLDMELIRGIDVDRVRQAIVLNVTRMARQLGIEIVAEGIETRGEAEILRNIGIRLMQGYFFAKPLFEGLPTVDFAVMQSGNKLFA